MSLHNLTLQLSLYISKVVHKASTLRLHGQQATHQKLRSSANDSNLPAYGSLTSLTTSVKLHNFTGECVSPRLNKYKNTDFSCM